MLGLVHAVYNQAHSISTMFPEVDIRSTLKETNRGFITRHSTRTCLTLYTESARDIQWVMT
jgi:hypothetical protein